MDSFFVQPGTNYKRPRNDDHSHTARTSSDHGGFKRARGRRDYGVSRRGVGARGGRRGTSSRASNSQPYSDEGAEKLKNGSTKHKKFSAEDEEISSGESEDEQMGDNIRLQTVADDSEFDETEQEKRLRLTKEYLKRLEEHADEKDVDQKLQEDVLEAAGRLRRKVADEYIGADLVSVLILRGHSGHKLSVTCISSDDTVVYSGGKEGSLIKWDVKRKTALKKILADKSQAVGHSGSILAMSLTSDGTLLASGGADKLIKIWTTANMDLFHTFRGHRDIVTGLAFRMNSHEMFSCSQDRNVKVWNVAEKSYVETLYGHQHAVLGIDSFHRERCITAGGQDFSVRIWKVLEESQLVFQLQFGSVECISLVDEEHFVTGSDDGSVLLWGAHKKKPMYTMRQVHKKSNGEVCWVSSIDALKNSDMFASGANSGEIFVWKIQEGYRSMSIRFRISVVGFVNSLKFVADGSTVIAGIGQEHRMGRWWREKDSKNSVHVFPLLKSSTLVLHSETDQQVHENEN